VNNRSPNACYSAVECHLFPLFKELLTEMAEMTLSGEEDRNWNTIAPPVSVLKSLNFKTNTGVL